MSGGFFRGTSADQDTRFSNKQAKLLKSQKFVPELEHLVDMTKVKMDVIRPWIASRVTELLGFEDEVLINFIYGLLDAKEVNGKEVQISLTGFMEKNTVKFMKELWTLLLSAQKNASGVPQQFLDAKEEETRKNKAEVDRIANEIQKKKENEIRELEQERLKKMDGVVESKAISAALEPTSKHVPPKSSSARPEDEKEADERNGARGRKRGSRSRSISKSYSNSRSYSDDRHKSRTVSRSPGPQGRSISSDRLYRSPRRRSVTPRRRHSPRASISPSRRRSSYSGRRSRSRSPCRSPSPVRGRLRSPYRRRPPTPVRRRRSPSPIRRRRSPTPIRRRRSPSPFRRRRSPSPFRRYRSPSPMRRRSPPPVRRRSPSLVRRRSLSPVRRRSPSPVRRQHRRPSTPRHRSRSPMRDKSPISGRRRSTTSRGRSLSPHESSSLSPIQHRSPSPVRRQSSKDRRGSPVQSSEERIRSHERSSPVLRRPSSSLRPPQRDPKDRKDSCAVLSPSVDKSPSQLESPVRSRKKSAGEDGRLSSLYDSPVRQTREQMIRDGGSSPPRKPREQKPRHDSPEISKEEKETSHTREARDHKSKFAQKRSIHSSIASKQKNSPGKLSYKEDYSPERLAGRRSVESRSRFVHIESKEDLERKSEKSSWRGARHEILDQQRSPTLYKESGEGQKSEDRNCTNQNNVKDSDWRRRSDAVTMSVQKINHNKRDDNSDSGSEESDKHRARDKEKRKHKRSDRKEVASDDEYLSDSEIEDRKEAKRRRKEEKKLKKEEKRRRREERRRKREERRAEKMKMKNRDDSDASDGERIPRRESHSSDNEETESEQKKLEIELRNKALESLKAKKGIKR